MSSVKRSPSVTTTTASAVAEDDTTQLTMTQQNPSAVAGTDRRHEPPSILLAEDDSEMRCILALHLRRRGYRVTECCDGAELLTHLTGYVDPHVARTDPEQFHLVITDIRMPGVFGLSVVEGSQQCPHFPPVILITAFGDAETHDAARRFGVRAVFDKPFDLSEILARVHDILKS